MNASRAVVLRGMTADDVDAGLRLCRQSQWNQVARDWEQFLLLSPGGATVAVDDAGAVIGSVATVRYSAASQEPARRVAVELARREFNLDAGTQDPDCVTPREIAAVDDPAIGLRDTEPGTLDPVPDTMAWIAMVLVDPAHRGGGIGTALLQRGLEHVTDVTTIGLDATPLGRPLYEALGFRADTTLTRMRREPSPPVAGRVIEHDRLPQVRRATPGDRAAIAGLDAQVTGLDRGTMLAWLQSGDPELAWVFDSDRGIEGVVLGRPGYAAIHLGPVIGPSTDVAAALVRAALSAQAAHAVLIDVVDDRPGWRHAVEALGFQPQRPFTRMYRGDWRPPHDPTLLYAIIGPEFG